MSDIPDHILNYNPDATQEIKQDYKKLARKSGFMIVINPNLGKAILRSQEQRVIEYRKMSRMCDKLGEAFKAQLFQKPKDPEEKDFEAVPVIKYSYSIEIGEGRQSMHVNVVVVFDGCCHIDKPKLDAFLYPFYNHKVYLRMNPFNWAVQEAIEAYASKAYQKSKQELSDRANARDIANAAMPIIEPL